MWGKTVLSVFGEKFWLGRKTRVCCAFFLEGRH